MLMDQIHQLKKVKSVRMDIKAKPNYTLLAGVTLKT